MATDDGPLVAADESFVHQIVETHTQVANTDRAWTEKVCAMAAARDGSLQVAFGVGKYTNRNVFDGSHLQFVFKDQDLRNIRSQLSKCRASNQEET